MPVKFLIDASRNVRCYRTVVPEHIVLKLLRGTVLLRKVEKLKLQLLLNVIEKEIRYLNTVSTGNVAVLFVQSL